MGVLPGASGWASQAHGLVRTVQMSATLQAMLHDTNIVPPLDMHWIWHSHMLNPTKYREDCQAMVGCIVDDKCSVQR